MNDDPAGARDSAGQPEAAAARNTREGASGESHAEQVLSQALRLMAGGDSGRSETRPGGRGPRSAESRRRLTTGQLLLLAAIVGLLVGIVAGFVSLLL